MYSGIKTTSVKILPEDVRNSTIPAKLSFIVEAIFSFFNDNSLFLIPKFVSKYPKIELYTSANRSRYKSLFSRISVN